MSNGTKSQPQAARAALGGISDGVNVAQVPRPEAFHLFQLADPLKTGSKTVHFCPSLIDSDRQTAFYLSYRKKGHKNF
jgi:hypothetical protein